ncbi:MAG: septation protein SepH [Micropruina glycogenica]
MRTARPLGLSPDGRSLIVVVDGEQLAIPADDKLRAALRNDRARMGQLEIEMESALRPRDIQARIRAGESLEAVAQAAGVPMAQIEPFAAPVIAEREHIAGLAQSNPVRRAGDAVAHRSLRAVVSDRLLSRGIDADSVDWDAWRSGERRWTVRLSYESGSAHRQADFTYDQTGRFSVAANEDARWLTGEHSSSHGPQPGRKRHTDEASAERSHDDNDELAIVRAIQPQFEVTPDIDDDDDLLTDSPDNEDAFAEGDLAEVDGVYDIIPGDRSNMDVLYDMLSTFDEDSVQIYAGLVRPAPDEDAAPVVDPGVETVVVVESVEVIELELDDDAEPAVDEAGATDVPTERLPSGDDEASASEDGEEAIFAEVPIVHSPLADEPPHEDFE